jgi:hypothetical protein
MDIEKINVCHDLGITYHEDLGLIDGFYCEKVRVGPIERIFKIERALVDYPCENPGDKRLEYLEKKVAELHEQISHAMNLAYPSTVDKCEHGKEMADYCEPCGRVIVKCLKQYMNLKE